MAISDRFIAAKEQIVIQWITYTPVQSILHHHYIEVDVFSTDYAENVFDYFMGVILGRQSIGDCPVMATFLNYLKDRDVSADELFVICSHFRRAMLDFTYDTGIDTRMVMDEISDIFDRNFTGVLKMYSDRIYQKELELEKSVTLLNEYKNAIDEGANVSKADMNGIITYASDNLVKLCGYSRSELVGQSHNILRHPEMPDLFFQDLWSMIMDKKVFKGTIKNRKKNGEYFYLDSTIVPIVDPANNIVEYMAIGYEVTKLIDARQQAVDAGQAKEHFLSNMSHEIRTPLNAILGFVTLLKDETTSTKHKKYLDIIHSSSENLLSIINDILDFSKLRNGEFTIEHRAFDLHKELAQILELFMPEIDKKQIRLLSFINPYIPDSLISDPLRIKQIVANLLSNAIKFAPVKGVIAVEVSCVDDLLNISVRDDGIGIAKEDHAKVFNAFLQTHDSSSYLYGGTGLGLSICLQLAKHMDGVIELESTPGEGSLFTLTLPVVRGTQGRVTVFDPTPFQRLSMVLLQQRVESESIALLRRYCGYLELDVRIINDLEGEEYDLLFFIDSEVDSALRQRIIDDKIPAIAMMDDLHDTYESIKYVAPLFFPIYSSKLYNTFLEALQLTDVYGQKSVEHHRQRRFRGSVLVAEDNMANQELVRILLHRYGLEYTVVSDGVDALELFKQERFDMVLMDEQMPNMSGLESMQAMITLELENGTRHVPIVALTANVLKGARERGLLAGYDAFLGKPIIIIELESVFEQFLEEEREDYMIVDAEVGSSKIRGIDEVRLLKELMLGPEQLMMLLKVFIKKMRQEIPELKKAVEDDDLEKIARLAHSIKGSSANFRMEAVQLTASKMEEAATSKKRTFDHKQSYLELEMELSKITIIE